MTKKKAVKKAVKKAEDFYWVFDMANHEIYYISTTEVYLNFLKDIVIDGVSLEGLYVVKNATPVEVAPDVNIKDSSLTKDNEKVRIV